MSKEPTADPDIGLSGRVEHAAERFVPQSETDRLVAAEHWGRYRLAASLAKGARVLDAGCGVGYGAVLLADAGAASVLGLDLSEQAIEQARLTAPANASFEQGDLRSIPAEEDSFDMIACFEVIEHLEEQEAVADELRRVLAPGGVLLVSSPNREVYLAGNPHHVRELTPDELVDLLAPRFAEVRLLRQQAWSASAVMGDEDFGADDPRRAMEPGDVSKVDAETPGMETFTVAVAGDAPLPAPVPQVVLSRPVDLRGYMDAIKALESRVRDAEGTAVAAVHERREAVDARERAELHNHELQDHLDRAREAIADITGSLSWRITSPLRRLKGRRGQ